MQLTEHWRRAIGGNADHQRRPVDDRAEGKVAKLWIVDNVDRNAGRVSCIREPLGVLVVVEGADLGARVAVRPLAAGALHPRPSRHRAPAARRLREARSGDGRA